MVSDADIAALSAEPRGHSRRISARSAWAVLDLLSDIIPDGLSRSELQRARVGATHADELSPGELAARAHVRRLRGPKGSHRHLIDDARIVRSAFPLHATRGWDSWCPMSSRAMSEPAISRRSSRTAGCDASPRRPSDDRTPAVRRWRRSSVAQPARRHRTPDRRRLRAVTALADESHQAWLLLGDERDDAYTAWTLLAGLT